MSIAIRNEKEAVISRNSAFRIDRVIRSDYGLVLKLGDAGIMKDAKQSKAGEVKKSDAEPVPPAGYNKFVATEGMIKMLGKVIHNGLPNENKSKPK